VRREASGVYRTEDGMIFRVTESDEGSLKIEVLKDDVWIPGRIGMVGLRHEASTKMLSPGAIRRLPA
jgi:hypothetical protein